MSKIEVTETIYDKRSNYNYKIIKMNDLIVHGHLKVLDTNYLTNSLLKEYNNIYTKENIPILLETTKNFEIKQVNTILTSNNKIKDHFRFADWIGQYNNILTPSFSFNPVREFSKFEKITGFYDYYYHYSDNALFIPNVNFYNKNEQIMDIDDYFSHISESYNYLNYKNNKPIFIPIPLDIDISLINNIGKFLIKNEFTNFWFDFKGNPSNDRTKLGLIRHLNHLFNKNELSDNVVMYITKVRREIVTHTKDESNPASDILTPIIGSSFIGCNRDKQRMIKGPPLTKEQRIEMLIHKARKFDPENYYYQKVNQMNDLKDKEQFYNRNNNQVLNNILLNKELNKMEENFLPNQDLIQYLKSKRMLNEYEKGKLFRYLFFEKVTLDKWF